MRIHKEGYLYIVIASVIWIVLIWATQALKANIPALFYLIHIVSGLIWFWVIWFFRLPGRDYQPKQNLIIAPADGKVVVIEEVYEPEYFQSQRLQVSIFMSPLNVHVNRNPISGIVKYSKYHSGKYLVAWHPKSSTENERTTVVIENEKGPILLRQIAGAMARRICCYVKPGMEVKQLEEFGFIKFGSRVDLFLPPGTPLSVKIGDTVQGGITEIGSHI